MNINQLKNIAQKFNSKNTEKIISIRKKTTHVEMVIHITAKKRMVLKVSQFKYTGKLTKINSLRSPIFIDIEWEKKYCIKNIQKILQQIENPATTPIQTKISIQHKNITYPCIYNAQEYKDEKDVSQILSTALYSILF